MMDLKLLYTCVVIAFSPQPEGQTWGESFSQYHCGRTSSYEKCEDMARKKIRSIREHSIEYGYHREIEDFDFVCDEAYYPLKSG